MKTLTHYFKSSQEENRVSALISSENLNSFSSEQNDDKQIKVLEANACSSPYSICNKNNTAKNKKSKENKKKRRRQADPDVTNTSELVSPNQLSKYKNTNHSVLVSNKKTAEKVSKSCESDINEKCKDNASIVLNDSAEYFEDTETKANIKQKEEKPSKTRNAFDFMMESRNKSIGRNSPGKEEKEDREMSKNKEDGRKKLEARKSLLQNWADSKGGLKRKRLEDERDLIIQHKLDKRKKRLKKLLTNEDREETDKTNDSRENSESDCTIIKVKMFTPKKGMKNTVSLMLNKKEDIVESPKKKNKNKREVRLSLKKDNHEERNAVKENTPKEIGEKKKKSKQIADEEVIEINSCEETKSGRPKRKCTVVKSYTEILNDSDINHTSEKRKSKIENASEKSNIEKAKPVKLAPIFIPKPKIDQAVVEAKRNFLMSGIPDSMKKTIEKQQSVEDIEFDVFPKISHVQQKDESSFWNLSSLNTFNILKVDSPMKLNYTNFTTLIRKVTTNNNENLAESTNITLDVRNVLKEIKGENPEYPVYKMFRLLKQKNCRQKDNLIPEETTSKKTKKTKRHKKKKSIEIVETEPPKVLPPQMMWTENYRLDSSEEIIGNSSAVKQLKDWLQNWIDFSKDTNKQTRSRKHNNSSSSEFENADSDSRDSTCIPNSAIIITGPSGSGKTATVYALCNELGMNVLELNASSKRTGKRLLQELQEATQSHQVRDEETTSIASFFKNNKPKPKVEPLETKSRKICVLLIEDVDIVFEQDEGFTTALSQLLYTSKRPVILTTTDETSLHLQKFIHSYNIIRFSELKSEKLAVWLQLVCLLEGLYVQKKILGELLDYFKGDMRKCLLQLQFLVVPLVSEDIKTENVLEDKKVLDELSNTDLADVKLNVLKNSERGICVKNCLVFEGYDKISLPKNVSLEIFWWNLPDILKNDIPEDSNCTPVVENLKSVCDILDSLAFVDVLCRKNKTCVDAEPTLNRTGLKDSLELRENMCMHSESVDLIPEIKHHMLENSVGVLCKRREEEMGINMGLPNLQNKRWRKRQFECNDGFSEAIPLSARLDRKAIAADYLPLIRQVARTENTRATNNNKRGNRFYNYLQNLGIDCQEKVLSTSYEIFACKS